MGFKELDPEVVLDILADEVDVLTPAVEERTHLYNDAKCPCCGAGEFGLESRPMGKSDLIPYPICVCQSCGCKWDPRSSIVLRDGQITLE